jgi:hypothetical protein
MSMDDESALVRVDSPTDVLFLEPNDPLFRHIEWAFPSPAVPLPPSFDYKAQGNALFKQKKHLLAVKAYFDGLAASPSDEQKLLLLLNRSQAHLLLGNFGAAYHDSTAVLSLLDSDVSSPPLTEAKAYLRQARALEGLRKLDLALIAFEKVAKLDPSGSGGKDGKRRIETKIRQSKKGDYDRSAFEKGKVAKEGHSFDIGDFTGPIQVVELAERGGGRGVVATRTIEAGELLLGARSFSLPCVALPDTFFPRTTTFCTSPVLITDAYLVSQWRRPSRPATMTSWGTRESTPSTFARIASPLTPKLSSWITSSPRCSTTLLSLLSSTLSTEVKTTQQRRRRRSMRSQRVVSTTLFLSSLMSPVWR